MCDQKVVFKANKELGLPRSVRKEVEPRDQKEVKKGKEPRRGKSREKRSQELGAQAG